MAENLPACPTRRFPFTGLLTPSVPLWSKEGGQIFWLRCVLSDNGEGGKSTFWPRFFGR